MIRVNAKDLLNAVTIATAATHKKHQPYIRIHAAGGVLTVRGQYEGTEASAMLLCEGEVSAAVLAKPFLDAIAACTPNVKGRPKAGALAPQLTLEHEGDKLTVTGTSTITVVTPDNEECPEMAHPELGDPVIYDAEGFVDTLDFILEASSQDVTRYNLNTIFFRGTQAVSTDGHRLHLESSLPDVGGEFLVPRQAGEIARKVVRYSKAETVTASFGGGYASFTAGMATVTCRLSEAIFPSYEQVIPRNQDKVTVVDHRSFLSALRQGLTAAPDKSGIVALHFGPECRVEAESVEFGKVKAPFTAKCEGEFKVGFNARYLVSFMEAFNGDAVQIGFDDELSPLKAEHDNRTVVVMPCRI